MKKAFNFAIFAIIALALPYTLASAETDVAGQVTVVAPATPVATTDETLAVEQPLTVRKAAAEKNLRAIHAQFAVFATRTQAAIDRLTVKNIDTTKAQAALTLSTDSLALAKTNLDLFTALMVTDDKDQDTTELKASLKTIEENLKSARTHLIESLTELKAAIVVDVH